MINVIAGFVEGYGLLYFYILARLRRAAGGIASE